MQKRETHAGGVTVERFGDPYNTSYNERYLE